ncbi:MAG: ABC transporter permease [Chloroflexi bacterium]|nr:ABC transporter permease [Chloroflexota bacterium]
MLTYIIRRILISIPVLWGVLTATFFAFRLIPGDPVDIMLFGRGTAADRVRLRHELGLDKPLLVQYWDFLKGAVHFDFGSSIVSRQTVWHEITVRFPTTLQLAVTAFVLATILGLIAGVISAFYNRRPLGLGLTTFAVLGISLPEYWVGTMLALIFGVQLGWLPVAGTGGPQNLILPAVTLAIPISSGLTRLVRVSVLQELGSDYVRTAHAKGLDAVLVMFRHVLRNALIPIITLLGTTLASLLGGVVIIENVFNWPGLGTLAVSSAGSRDFPVIEGLTFFIAVLLIGANLVVDVLYALVDPRIRYS